MRRLHSLCIRVNHHVGNIWPDILTLLLGLQAVSLDDNRLQGTLPEGLGAALSLTSLSAAGNEVTGSLPDSFFPLARLSRFNVARNKLNGYLPGVLGNLVSLDMLYIATNELEGSLPETICFQRTLASFRMFQNKITGDLPEGLWALTRLTLIILSVNEFEGTLPDAISSVRELFGLYIRGNELEGPLPESLQHLSHLSLLDLAGNAMSGSLPSGLFQLTGLKVIECRMNFLEGSLPASLGGLLGLQFLGLAKRGQQQGIRSSLPNGLARLSALVAILAQRNRLEGSVPNFVATLELIVLHQNALKLLPPLRLKGALAVLLHRNRLSCELPGDSGSIVDTCLVALGNQLPYPPQGSFPCWVSPYERDGLFWWSRLMPLYFLLKFAASGSMLVMACRRKVGRRKYLLIMSQWRSGRLGSGILVQAFGSLFNHIALHTLGGCILLSLVLGSSYYTCPAAFTFASACLTEATVAQIVVIVLWMNLCSATRQPWCMSPATHANSGAPVITRALCWSAWILLVLVLSQMLVLNIAAKTIPGFLTSGKVWTKLLAISTGASQSLLSGALIPCLARKVGYINKVALVTVASAFSALVLPSLLVLYLDEHCYGNWAEWWAMCTHPDIGFFKQQLRSQVLSLPAGTPLIEHDEVCDRTEPISAAGCAKSIARKLQEIALDKLEVSVLLLPAGRLAFNHHYSRAGDVLVKLSLLLQIAIFFGSPLPLLSPLLLIGLVSEKLVAVVSWKEAVGFGENIPKGGDLEAALAMTWVCSAIFHYHFVSDDPAASALLLTALAMFLAGKPRALPWSRRASRVAVLGQTPSCARLQKGDDDLPSACTDEFFFASPLRDARRREAEDKTAVLRP